MAAARFFLLLAAAAGAVWCGAALIQTHAELHLGDCSLRVSDPEPIPCTRALFGAYGSRQHGAPTTFSLLVPSAVSRAPPSAPRGPGELPHGCSVKDFTPMEPAVEHGRVAAVVRRGKCSFYAKAETAMAVGASLLVVVDPNPNNAGMTLSVGEFDRFADLEVVGVTGADHARALSGLVSTASSSEGSGSSGIGSAEALLQLQLLPPASPRVPAMVARATLQLGAGHVTAALGTLQTAHGEVMDHPPGHQPQSHLPTTDAFVQLLRALRSHGSLEGHANQWTSVARRAFPGDWRFVLASAAMAIDQGNLQLAARALHELLHHLPPESQRATGNGDHEVGEQGQLRSHALSHLCAVLMLDGRMGDASRVWETANPGPRPSPTLSRDPLFASTALWMPLDLIDLSNSTSKGLLVQLHSQLALYSDEMGFFDQSLAHLDILDDLVGTGQNLHVRFRRETQTPTVFSPSLDATAAGKWNDRRRAPSCYYQRTLSSGTEPVHLRDPMLAYTSTPSTMMVGYQGGRDHGTMAHIHRCTDYPNSTTTMTAPKLSPHKATREGKLRVAFVSSFLWAHSVGRLFGGVITALNTDLLDVHAVVITRRLSADISQSDSIQRPIKHHLVSQDAGTQPTATPHFHHVSWTSGEEVLTFVTALGADVIVYPELGMDSAALFLASHRAAPLQVVLWGHPVSQGVNTVDMFVSSDLYEPRNPGDARSDCTEDSTNVNGFYNEQLVRFDSLTTSFQRPPGLTSERDPNERRAVCAELGVPTDARLYGVPQSLMKFHGSFDHVLRGVVDRDPGAVVLITYKKNQVVWKNHLERRLGHHHHRIRFIPVMDKQSYFRFLKALDVMIDPFPFGGGVTSLEALAAGTIVVTLPERQTVVRLAAGFYRHMNMTDSAVVVPGTRASDLVGAAVSIANDERGAATRIRRDVEERKWALFEDDGRSKDAEREWNGFFGAVRGMLRGSPSAAVGAGRVAEVDS